VVNICTEHSTCLHLGHIVYLCTVQSAAKWPPFPNRMLSVMFVMTNLKHTQFQNHMTLLSLGGYIFDSVICYDDLGHYYYQLRVRSLSVDWNFGCDCYVAQLKDVDFIVTLVLWNKLHVGLCESFNTGKLFFLLCVLLFQWKMEATRYCDISALTCQTTRCQNAETQNRNSHCSQTLSAIRYKCTECRCVLYFALWYWRKITAWMYSSNYTGCPHTVYSLHWPQRSIVPTVNKNPAVRLDPQNSDWPSHLDW
jgi:hypothetical protein